MIAISAETIGRFPSLRGAGLYHRSSTFGEEKQLVDGFIRHNLTPPSDSQTRLVFVEPRLETGFPDVVVVYLDKLAAEDWSIERASLGKPEICLLHHLATDGSQDSGHLLAIFANGLKVSLSKLEAAGLIRKVQDRWCPLSTRKLLAVRRIVAIEAKVGAWRGGLDQAFMNRWFASESYLLLPARPKSAEMEMELRASGVGLVTSDTPLRRPLVRAQKGKLPGSYASWLFNEWACHAGSVKALPKPVAASRPGRSRAKKRQ